jgi:hypothetical protein
MICMLELTSECFSVTGESSPLCQFTARLCSNSLSLFSHPHTTVFLPAPCPLLPIRYVQPSAASVSFSLCFSPHHSFPLLEAPAQPKEAQTSQCNTLEVLRANRCVDMFRCPPLLDAGDLGLSRLSLLCFTLFLPLLLFRDLATSTSFHFAHHSVWQAFYRCNILNFLPTTHVADHRTASRQAHRAGPWSRQSNR